MSDLALVLKNTLALNLGSVVANLLSFCTTLLIARWYGEARFGQYTFALSFAGLFLVLMELGIDQVLIRDISREKTSTSRYLATAFLLRLVLAGTALAFMGLLEWLLPQATGTLRYAVILAGVYVALQTLSTVVVAAFRAHERMEWVALVSILLKTFTLLGAIATIALGGGIRMLLATFVIAAAMTVVVAGACLPRIGIRWSWAWDGGLGRYLVVQSLPIAGAFVCAAINGQLDVVLVRYFWDDASVGLYGAALTFTTALLFVSTNLGGALYPRFAQLAGTSRAQLAQYYERSLVYLAAMGLPMATVMMSWADPLMVRLYGVAYRGAVPTLQILGWVLAVQSINIVFYALLLAMNRQWLAFVLCAVSSVLSLILDFWWIPRWGLIGAATARLVVLLVSFVMFYLASAWLLYRASLVHSVLKPALAAAVVGLAAWGMRDLAWWMSVPLVGVVYLVALAWLQVFSRHHMLRTVGIVTGKS